MAKILFITPMWYEEATPTDAKVCNYFVDEWGKQGNEIVVIHYRSKFPKLYLLVCNLLPALSKFICGDSSDYSKETNDVRYDHNGILILSNPISKYIPHGRFMKSVLDKEGQKLIAELDSIGFVPDAIIGHFCNPTIEIIERIKTQFPDAKTAVVFHEGSETISRIIGKNAEKRLNQIDVLGYRSLSIQRSIEQTYKLINKRFICYSGISSPFLKQETHLRKWEDAPLRSFLFVGRMVNYKHPYCIAEALYSIYQNKGFTMRYIGKDGTATKSTIEFVRNKEMGKVVHFLGQINRNDIIQWYDKSDCFIMISDNEVFGLVYLEAMARGCITIAGSNGGMEGIIKSGENGFLCTPGNVQELTSIIKRINEMSAEEKARISENAKQTAKYYSDRKVAELYLNNIL